MTGEVPPASRTEAEDESDHQSHTEHPSQRVDDVAGGVRAWEELVEPQRGQRQAQPGDHHDAPGSAVPRPPAPEARHELEGTHEREDDGADDVNDDGERRRVEPRILRQGGRSAEQLDEAEDAGDHRDGDEGDQGGRNRPAPGGAGRRGRASGHRTVEGSTRAVGTTAGEALVSTELVSVDAVRWLRQSETPSAIIAMP